MVSLAILAPKSLKSIRYESNRRDPSSHQSANPRAAKPSPRQSPDNPSSQRSTTSPRSKSPKSKKPSASSQRQWKGRNKACCPSVTCGPPWCKWPPQNRVTPSHLLTVFPSALGIPPTKDELSEFVSILDPDSEGYASYDSFFAICALKFHQRDDDGSDDSAHRGELDEAFSLFTQGSATGTITLTHLKRVAALLKEEVAEELLRDMIQEANGGAGIGAGVRKEEFDDVMRRAGVWR